MSTNEALTHPSDRVDLPIGGMSCASCAARVEKAIAALPGVDDCNVNFATETATVRYDAARVGPDVMRAAVTGLGYTAPAPVEHRAGAHDHMHHDEDPLDIRRRLVVAVVLGVPVVLISMVPALMFDGWQWVAGILATPIVFWSGWSVSSGSGISGASAGGGADASAIAESAAVLPVACAAFELSAAGGTPSAASRFLTAARRRLPQRLNRLPASLRRRGSRADDIVSPS